MPNLAPVLVRHAPLVAQLADRLRALIEVGEWPVGERIPGEHRLAEEFGVSRGTVREALRALSLAGLLEPRVGDGTYVRTTDEIAGVLLRDDAELGHVLDARAGLEAAAARLAAGAAPASPALVDVAPLDAALARRSAAHDAGDLADYIAADADFHRAVVAASGNPVLLRLFDGLSAAILRSIEETSALPEDPRVGAAHRDLAAAIRHGDVETAGALPYALVDAVRAAQPSVVPKASPSR